MSKVLYTQEDLNTYLLGRMSAADTERFDELSVTSDEFAAALDAAQFDLVDSYVNGELSAEERSRFEERYLERSSSRSKVHFAKVFQNFGLERTQQPILASESTGDARSTADGFFVFAVRYLRWGFAAAAAALVMVVGWVLFQGFKSSNEFAGETNTPTDARNSTIGSPDQASEQGNDVNASLPGSQTNGNEKKVEQAQEVQKDGTPNTNRPERDRPEAARVFAISLAPQLRGGGQVPSFSISPDVGRVTVRIQLEPNDFHSFRVTLREQASGRSVWQSGILRSSRSGVTDSISANVPGSVLRGATYSFAVSGISSSGSEMIGDYTFKVVR